MTRMEKVRNLPDEKFIEYMAWLVNKANRCEVCAKNGTRCNPYTGKDCKTGIEEYYKSEGIL